MRANKLSKNDLRATKNSLLIAFAAYNQENQQIKKNSSTDLPSLLHAVAVSNTKLCVPRKCLKKNVLSEYVYLLLLSQKKPGYSAINSNYI